MKPRIKFIRTVENCYGEHFILKVEAGVTEKLNAFKMEHFPKTHYQKENGEFFFSCDTDIALDMLEAVKEEYVPDEAFKEEIKKVLGKEI
ncbi:MAG: hypothetical protein K6G40_01060 [Eubacterium sp.]|nr:hypothetical protein [Eubacterium sp.]